MSATYYDPEEYVVTRITIAVPVGPATWGGPHIVTIEESANSTACEVTTIEATADEVGELDSAWIALLDTAKSAICEELT